MNELTFEEQQEVSNKECKQRIQDIVRNLFDELNHMGNEEKVGEYFVNAIRSQHRTLQQNFFGKVIVPVIKDFAYRYNDGQYDLRNEQSCKVANKLEPILKDEHFPFI